MSKDQKNLIALGLVALTGYLFFTIDDSKAKAKKAAKRVEKRQNKQANAARNRSWVDLLSVSSPLLKPVINVAIDEFKARHQQKQLR